MTIAVIDYGMGNLHSVAKALEHVADVPVVITHDADEIRRAERVVLPGQGAIRDCMKALEHAGLTALVRELLADDATPLLGICVGQQMLMSDSEENGGITCLDYLPGQVRRFPDQAMDATGMRLKVPHMGWNEVFPTQLHPLFDGITPGERFYFVHSYYVAAKRTDDVFATTEYGGITPHVAVGHGSNFAVQFHPEKSATAGLRLLSNFVHWQR